MRQRAQTATRFFLSASLACGISFQTIAPSIAQTTRVSPIPSVRKARIKTLLEQLRTAGWAKRSRIIREIRRMGPSTVPDLVNGLKGSDPLVISGVAEALGFFGDKATPAIPQLVTLLDNQQSWVLPQNYSTNRRFAIPPIAIPAPIYDSSRSRSVPPRNKKIPMLVPIAPPSARKRVPQVDRLPEVRSLPRIKASKPRRLVPRPQLKPSDPSLRSLDRSHSSVPLEKDPKRPERTNTNRTKRRVIRQPKPRRRSKQPIGRPKPRPIVKPYYRPPGSPDRLVRISAAAALGNIATSARTSVEPRLAKGLKDNNPWMRLTTAWALNQIGADTATLPTYLELIQHSNESVRRSTLIALSNRPSLTGKMIGRITDKAAIEQFVMRLSEPSPGIRSNVYSIVRKFGSKAVPALIRRVEDSDPLAKLTAIQALGRMKFRAKPAVPQLIQALRDRSEYQPTRGSGALPRLFSRPLPAIPRYRPTSRYFSLRRRPRLQDNQLTRVAAALAIGQIRPKLTPELRKELLTGFGDDTASMRLSSAWALLQLRPNSFDRRNAARVLSGVLAIPDKTLSREANYILQALGKPAAPFLTIHWRNQLQSREKGQQIQAVLALGRLGEAALPAVPDLRNLLTSRDRNLRNYSTTVLAKISRTISWQSTRGNLPSADRERAIIEFRQVLNVLEKPGAKFNRIPVARVRRSLRILEKNRPNYRPLQST